MVLFGSHVSGDFVLDTLLVVCSYAEVRQGSPLPNWESELHRRITMERVHLPPCGVRLYAGATWSADKPFSFVPCVRVSGDVTPFARPRIQPTGPLRSVVQPAMKLGFKRTTASGAASAREVWDEIVDQVLEQGCSLGTHVEEPAS
jgi:hypothetical protein